MWLLSCSWGGSLFVCLFVVFVCFQTWQLTPGSSMSYFFKSHHYGKNRTFFWLSGSQFLNLTKNMNTSPMFFFMFVFIWDALALQSELCICIWLHFYCAYYITYIQYIQLQISWSLIHKY